LKKIVCISIIYIFLNIVFGLSTYIPLEKKEIYLITEYQVLKNNSSSNLFVLNQPYKFDDIGELYKKSDPLVKYLNFFDIYKITDAEEFTIVTDIGINYFSDEAYKGVKPLLHLMGIININRVILVNEAQFNQKYYDPEFHGNKTEWAIATLSSSYANYQINENIELFSGRLSRNFGTLNDFGLMYSNNPYPLSHFGFSAGGRSLKYSFYTSRLNSLDCEIIGDEDYFVNTGENCNRFWAIQKFDWKIKNNFQISLSEASLYGGVNQSFESSNLNPVIFFYDTQINERIPANNYWQLNCFYKIKKGIGLYLDFFVDDIVVNNEPDVNDVAIHPNRFGLLGKISSALQNRSLISARYVRISNETYTSLKNYENYLYHKKSIGYPYNSFESIKFSFDSFNQIPFIYGIEMEFWRKGDKEVSDYFINEINTFPIIPVTKGYSQSLYVSNIISNKIRLQMTFQANFYNNLNPDYVFMFAFKYYYEKKLIPKI